MVAAVASAGAELVADNGVVDADGAAVADARSTRAGPAVTTVDGAAARATHLI